MSEKHWYNICVQCKSNAEYRCIRIVNLYTYNVMYSAINCILEDALIKIPYFLYRYYMFIIKYHYILTTDHILT